MHPYQELKIQILPKSGRLIVIEADLPTIREFQSVLEVDRFLTLEHIEWFGWELVAATSNYFYYKRSR